MRIFIDPYAPSPAHIQIQEEIRFGCLQGTITLGTVLPSIRQLARHLGVGGGVVRRAYRELSQAGLLVTKRRRHVVASRRIAADQADILRLMSEQSEQVTACALEYGVSNVAMHRLLSKVADVRERRTPSLLYVDICRLAARRSAAVIAKGWRMGVPGIALGDFGAVWNDVGTGVSVVLVNEYLREDLRSVAGLDASRVFSLRMRLEKRLYRRLDELPARSVALFLYAEQELTGAVRCIREHCQRVFGRRSRLQSRKISDVRDLPRLIRSEEYRVFLFSPLAWEELPESIKRMRRVAPAFIEPTTDSLEDARIRAGIFL